MAPLQAAMHPFNFGMPVGYPLLGISRCFGELRPRPKWAKEDRGHLTLGLNVLYFEGQYIVNDREVAILMSGPFTSGEVQKLVGLTQRQLAYWDVSSLAHPNGRPAQGSGSRRLYTFLDVLQLKLIRRLRQAGLSLQKIRQALINLSDLADEPAPLAELEVVADGHRILIGRSDEQLVDPLVRQYVLRFPLADLLAEMEQQISLPSLGRTGETGVATFSEALH